MEYRCDKCNKMYSSYQSLWIHNRKFHNLQINNQSVISQSSSSHEIKIKPQIIYMCMYCKSEYKHKQSKWKHEKKCKENHNIKNEELLLKLKEQEQEILKLKLKLQKSKKADIVTLKQLNKVLLERHAQYLNYINNINNGTIYNGNVQNVVNNIQLIGFGKEHDILETLTKKEKKLIIDSRYKCLEKFIEIVHCGKYDKFKNIIVTNVKDNYMYKYDDDKGQFILATKDDTINSLIDNRMYELETIYDELLEKNKLDEQTKNIVENFINKLNNDDTKYTDEEGHVHDTYKKYKINEIKLILYNNQDKIMNDISLLLTTSEK